MMRRSGPLPQQVAGFVLLAASLMDIAVLLFVTVLVSEHVAPALNSAFPMVPPILTSAVFFAVLLYIYWVVTELLLGGASLGRVVLGLSPRTQTGKPLARSKLVTRALRKLFSFGLSGLNPARPARYDAATGVVWFAPIAPPMTRPLGQWKLQFLNGALSGKAATLSTLLATASDDQIRFGRDRNWAGFAIDKDGQRGVSSQHCSLIVKPDGLFLRDGNGQGKPSTHGSFLDGEKLAPNETRPVGTAEVIGVGGVKIRIIR